MKCAVVLCFLALGVVTLARPHDSQYTDKFDKINLGEILENKRLLMPYVNCALGEGRCTSEGKELKTHLKEALETNCAKCTTAQRQGSERVIGHLIKYEPDSWQRLKAKYDPSGKYSKKYETEIQGVKA